MDNHLDAIYVSKKIIHIDMDAFFASVEQLDFPELKGKPIAVGGNKERGVVAAASYEARKFGVKSALSSVLAARLCPDLIFVPPRFSRYKEISNQIHEIFFSYTDLVEPLSLDEAYLDVTERSESLDDAVALAREIKAQILSRVGLTASAGVSYNKFLAKTASDLDKPDGLSIITEEEADLFLKKLPVNRFFGIGQATAEKMKKAGIFTGADLRKKKIEDLKLRFGKSGAYYFNICRGIDHREVQPDRERKSISGENTFDQNLIDPVEIHAELIPIVKTVFSRYERHGVLGKSVTLKIKYGDFKQITRSETLEKPIESYEELLATVKTLFQEDLIREPGIRLLGVGIHHFIVDHAEESDQLTFEF